MNYKLKYGDIVEFKNSSNGETYIAIVSIMDGTDPYDINARLIILSPSSLAGNTFNCLDFNLFYGLDDSSIKSFEILSINKKSIKQDSIATPPPLPPPITHRVPPKPIVPAYIPPLKYKTRRPTPKELTKDDRTIYPLWGEADYVSWNDTNSYPISSVEEILIKDSKNA